MLELAYLNQVQLKELYARKIMDEQNKFYYLNSYIDYDIGISSSEWDRIQYISKNSAGEILAYFGAWVNRGNHIIEKLEIINLSGKPNSLASRDFFRFLEFLFVKRKFRKIIFYVIINNPALKMYERWIVGQRIGKVVGTLSEHCLLPDGSYYDTIIFELYKENFHEWLKNHKK